jgi:hypothetical protein
MTTAQQWIEQRASELATEIEKKTKEEKKVKQINWSSMFMLATCDYLDACGIKPRCIDGKKCDHICPEHL